MNTQAILRIVIIAVAIINEILTISGKEVLPWSGDEIAEGISTIILVISTFIGWWKNNSFTKGAKSGDKIKNAVNAGIISTKTVDYIVDEAFMKDINEDGVDDYEE
jgi:SPP1 family holin